MPKLESKVQAEIIGALSAIPGCVVTRVLTSSTSGVSDLLVCYRGVFIALEVKRSEKAADPLQIAYLNSIIDAGGAGAVVWNVDQAITVLMYPQLFQDKINYIDKEFDL